MCLCLLHEHYFYSLFLFSPLNKACFLKIINIYLKTSVSTPRIINYEKVDSNHPVVVRPASAQSFPNTPSNTLNNSPESCFDNPLDDTNAMLLNDNEISNYEIVQTIILPSLSVQNVSEQQNLSDITIDLLSDETQSIQGSGIDF